MFIRHKQRNKIKVTFALLTWELCQQYVSPFIQQDFLNVQFIKIYIYSARFPKHSVYKEFYFLYALGLRLCPFPCVRHLLFITNPFL